MKIDEHWSFPDSLSLSVVRAITAAAVDKQGKAETAMRWFLFFPLKFTLFESCEADFFFPPSAASSIFRVHARVGAWSFQYYPRCATKAFQGKKKRRVVFAEAAGARESSEKFNCIKFFHTFEARKYYKAI